MKGACPRRSCSGGSTGLHVGAVSGDEKLWGRDEMPGQRHCSWEAENVNQGNMEERNRSGSE